MLVASVLIRTVPFDLEKLRQTEERILQASKARNTHSAYASAWRAFLAWCAAAGRNALPAEPGTVRDFLTWCVSEQYRYGSLTVRLNAIRHYHLEAGHPNPSDRSVWEYVGRIRRDLKEEPAGKAAITYDLLKRISERLPETPRGIRDRAMILLCFASGWRRSEIIALRYSDVSFVPQGLALWQRSSKTDQTGDGRFVGVYRGRRSVTCPVRALEAWLELRGTWDGALFTRMDKERGCRPSRIGLEPRGEMLYKAVKNTLAALGEDASRFGAHSLRAGMITESTKHGASEAAIMQRTGHKCSETLRRYIRPAHIFDFNPLGRVL